MSRLSVVTLTLALALVTSSASAAEWRLAGSALLDRSVSEQISPAADGKALELTRGLLVEDDGPAAGYSYSPNVEKLDDTIAIRKQLQVADPRTEAVYLLVGKANDKGQLQYEINGRPVELELLGKVGNYWDHFRLPPESIRAGLNDVVVRGTGQVFIARDDERPPGESPPPNRSAKSIDGGKTWNDARLGPKDETDGEYYIRLFLDQHRTVGTLTLPVVDQANLAEAPVAPPLDQVGPVKINVAADLSQATKISAFARSGSTFAVDDKTWSAWQPLAGLDAVVAKPAGRFIQFRLELTTSDPQQTPRVREVSISAEPQLAADWTSQLQFVETPSTRIIRSSIPFTYESPDHPRLQQLRKEYQLDEVVAGAKTEWEKILKLAAWSGVRWEKRTGHLSKIYPKWDALDILAKHEDGTPVGGFCQHYNLVFLQACESLGIRGRPVSLGPGVFKKNINGGHEVIEVWSNEHRKWVHVDGDAARYYVDVKTREPLSLRELHNRQVPALSGKPHDAAEAVVLADTRPAWGGFTDAPPFIELKLIPRSNFLAEPFPVPLNQGMKGWPWTGHYVWTEPSALPEHLYDKRVTAKSNWDWTLNETEVRLLATTVPGEVQVQLDTVTPGFTNYEATLDAAGPTPVESSFIWQLHGGKNRLVVQSRNETGPGIPTVVVVERTE